MVNSQPLPQIQLLLLFHIPVTKEILSFLINIDKHRGFWIIIENLTVIFSLNDKQRMDKLLQVQWEWITGYKPPTTEPPVDSF